MSEEVENFDLVLEKMFEGSYGGYSLMFCYNYLEKIIGEKIVIG